LIQHALGGRIAFFQQFPAGRDGALRCHGTGSCFGYLPAPVIRAVQVSFCSAANFTGAFSSQVESLGDSENATKEFYWSIFKPSGITWRLGKCDQTKV
jgi:hypothetical protein